MLTRPRTGEAEGSVVCFTFADDMLPQALWRLGMSASLTAVLAYSVVLSLQRTVAIQAARPCSLQKFFKVISYLEFYRLGPLH